MPPAARPGRAAAFLATRSRRFGEEEHATQEVDAAVEEEEGEEGEEGEEKEEEEETEKEDGPKGAAGRPASVSVKALRRYLVDNSRLCATTRGIGYRRSNHTLSLYIYIYDLYLSLSLSLYIYMHIIKYVCIYIYIYT